MKKIIFTPLLIFIAYLYTGATIHTITVSNFQFSPQNVPNVIVGDTVEWVWGNGFHTTTSLTIPAGAVAWDSPVTATITTFQYIVNVAGVYNYVCTPHAPNMSGSFTATSALPVVLTDFRVTSNGTQSILKWKTTSELNSKYFSVKRSLNGTDFFEIGQVTAAGISGIEQAYSFTDNNIPSRNKYVYYLIMIVDKDGRRQNSATRMVVNTAAIPKIITSLTPNPISKPGHLMLKFNADRDGSMEAVLSDMQGKSVLKTSLGAVKGINNGHIHLGDIAPGTYNLLFILNGVKELHRIVVK